MTNILINHDKIPILFNINYLGKLMGSFIKKEYKNIPFRFWLVKNENVRLSDKDKFADYEKYDDVFDKIKSLRSKKVDDNDDVSLLAIIIPYFILTMFAAAFGKLNGEHQGTTMIVIVILTMLSFFIYSHKTNISPERAEENLKKILLDYPVFKDVNFNDILSRNLIEKYFILPKERTNNDVVSSLLTFLMFHYFNDCHYFLNRYPVQITKHIYRNKQDYLPIIEKIALLAKKIERVHENGFQYLIESDDLIYEIMKDIDEVNIGLKQQKEKDDLFSDLMKTFSDKKENYLKEVNIFNEFVNNHSQFTKEKTFKLITFNPPTKNNHLSTTEIKRMFDEQFDNITQETNKLKAHNEELFKKIQYILKQ